MDSIPSLSRSRTAIYWPVIKFVMIVEIVALKLLVTGDHVCTDNVGSDAAVPRLLIVRFDVDNLAVCYSYYD